jgi:hypothetical protein
MPFLDFKILSEMSLQIAILVFFPLKSASSLFVNVIRLIQEDTGTSQKKKKMKTGKRNAKANTARCVNYMNSEMNFFHPFYG